MERLTAIQDKIRSTYGESVGDLILGPSEVLMRGYSNATVDEEAPKNDEMESALDEIDAKVVVIFSWPPKRKID